LAIAALDGTASMSPSPLTSTKENGPRPADVKASLRRLDREDSWRWWNAVFVITLLMGVIVVLSLPKLLRDDDPSFVLQLTLAVRGLLGLVLIFNVYTLYQQYLLKQVRGGLARQIEEASEQKARAEAFYELSILDPLTGLFNRRFSQERLEAEISRANRHDTPLGVVLFDLDKFKQINDRFGHGAGDLALQEFGSHLNKAIRGSDFAVRIGGDEFMVVLPECPPENVQIVLSRLASFEIDFGGNRIPISASAGWAQYRSPESAEEVIRRADEALYQQKVALSGPTPATRGYKYGKPSSIRTR
jgi:diguanylate cyclase (GGDEF)-like protein